MINRIAEKTIRSMLRGFPIVTLTGPRQSGKTTLARAVFKDRPYASLEEPDLRRVFQMVQFLMRYSVVLRYFPIFRLSSTPMAGWDVTF
jgi:AAA+ ATPase superfamily predicted ATPase